MKNKNQHHTGFRSVMVTLKCEAKRQHGYPLDGSADNTAYDFYRRKAVIVYFVIFCLNCHL